MQNLASQNLLPLGGQGRGESLTTCAVTLWVSLVLRVDPEWRIVPDDDGQDKMSFAATSDLTKEWPQPKMFSCKWKVRISLVEHGTLYLEATICILTGNCGLESQPGAFRSHWRTTPATDIVTHGLLS